MTIFHALNFHLILKLAALLNENETGRLKDWLAHGLGDSKTGS